MYTFSTSWLSPWSAREGNRIRHLVLLRFVLVLCFLSALICVAGHLHIYMHFVYVCLCAYCKYVLSLATDWAWGHPLQQLHLYWVNQCIEKFLCLQKTPRNQGVHKTHTFINQNKHLQEIINWWNTSEEGELIKVSVNENGDFSKYNSPNQHRIAKNQLQSAL